jgi:hypothetical protein
LRALTQVRGGWLDPLDPAAFGDPPARTRIAPFWFVNTDLGVDDARRQIQAMADGGCGGFFIHPRQGLRVPYLSQAWFDLVRAMVVEGAEVGLEAWLYDEYPYPSGIAGGLVTANRPHTRARVLERTDVSVTGGQAVDVALPMGRLVSALAVPVVEGRLRFDDALDLRRQVGVVLAGDHYLHWPMPHIPYNSRRYTADGGRLVLRWVPPPGDWRMLAAVEVDQRGFKYYDWFVDPLVPGAAEEFLAVTHERYAEELGEWFGTVIPGIFSDEIEAPAWSPELAQPLARHGIDLATELPALFYDDHPRADSVRRRWHEARLTLFASRWERPIRDWCDAHGLIWAAEKPVERPSQFWEVAQPATDAGHRRVDDGPEPVPTALRANNRAAMAAAEQSSREEVRCENFHSIGWGATLADQKWATDWLVVHGVNRFTPHAFYATSSGLRKHDAAPSFFVQTPAWAHYRALADYTGRLCLAASSGREAARIAVLYPTGVLAAGGRPAAATANTLLELMNLLLGEHHMFHPVDAQALLRGHATGDGALELGHTRYEVLVLAADPDDDSRSAVEAAHAAGVRVLTPELSAAELLSELEDARVVSVRASGSATELPDVWSLVRETGPQYLVLLANTTGVPVTVDVVVPEPVGSWERWNCETGAVTSLPGLDRLGLPAWGSALLVGSRLTAGATDRAAPPTVAAAAPDREPVPLDGTWERVLDRPNALRLNRWLAHAVPADDDPEAFAVPGSDDSGWTAVEAVPLRYRDTEQNVWVDQLALPVRPATVWYRRHLEIDAAGVAGDGMLRIEDGAIEGAWTLYVNGAEVDPVTGRAEAGPAGYLADVLLLPIGHLLTAGDNVLAIRVAARPESSPGGTPELRTPLHLVGTFDVGGTPDVRTLQRPLPGSGFGDRVGIPHFAGRIAYRRRQQTGGVSLVLPDTIGDPVGVSFADDDLGVRCWPPYRWDLPPGNGDLVVEVTTTMLPFYEGQQWVDGQAIDR